MQIAKELKDLFVRKKLTLALVESCTGGKMASTLTAIPGASEYFLGSLVTYSNQLKQKLLHVPAHFLQTYGAVSKEVVLAMLEGLFSVTNADWGVAVSGIAGPSGGSYEKPVGTVWVAIGKRGHEAVFFCLHLEGSRQCIIDETAARVLERLWREVLQ